MCQREVEDYKELLQAGCVGNSLLKDEIRWVLQPTILTHIEMQVAAAYLQSPLLFLF